MRQILITLLSVFFVSVQAQRYISLLDGKFVDSIDNDFCTRDIQYQDDGILITYNFKYVLAVDDPIYPNRTIFTIEGFGQNSIQGEPSFPKRTDSFSIPDGKTADLVVKETEYIEMPLKISPSRPCLSGNSDENYSKENVPMIVPYKGFYPTSIVSLIRKQEYRGSDILQLGVQPIQYHYERGITRFYSKIAYKVQFKDSPKKNKKSVISKNDPMLRNMTILPKASFFRDSKSILSNTEVKKDYLIITVPQYLEAVNRFAKWKRHMGFNVIVSSNISWTSDQVQSEVSSKYSSCDNLYYLLIVGSHSQIAGKRINPGKTPELYSDYYYGCMGGPDDMISDVYVGRLPVRSLSEANNIVSKIIDYERNPVTDEDFYKTGINCARFYCGSNGYESRRYVQTAERVRNYLTSKEKNIQRIYYADTTANPTHWSNYSYYYGTGDPLPSDLLRPTFAWDGSTSDIIDGINDGSFYCLYKGHGYVNEWVSPNFNLTNVGQLNNGNKYPIVFSICCESGWHFSNVSRCLADSFLIKPNGGAVGVFASIFDNNSGPNDVLAEGMFQAIWPTPGLLQSFGMSGYVGDSQDPVYNLGAILYQGFNRVDEFYLSHDIEYQYDDCQIAREYFHCFGDPSMEIRTETPDSFANVNIVRESNQIIVNLGGNTGRIVFYDESAGIVEAYEGNSAVYYGDGTSTIVCISAHNKIPYINVPTEYDIQNETITGNNTYSADKIRIGSNVTTSKPVGPVFFNSGTTNINGVTVEINGETTVNTGAVLNVNN